MRAPITSRKHIFQISQSTVAQAAVDTQTVIQGIEGSRNQPQHVAEGAIVKACYVEYWVSQDSASVVGSYTIIMYKNPSNGSGATAANMAALHDYDNKKNIIFTAQGLLTPNDGGQVPVIRGWYKIPKGKQRFGLNDTFQIVLRNNNVTAIDINLCGFVLYKEYT